MYVHTYVYAYMCIYRYIDSLSKDNPHFDEPHKSQARSSASHAGPGWLPALRRACGGPAHKTAYACSLASSGLVSHGLCKKDAKSKGRYPHPEVGVDVIFCSQDGGIN